MRPREGGKGRGAGNLAPALLLVCLQGLILAPQEASGQEQTQVDSTRLRIMDRLRGLARPPGIDSTYFLPDSLLPDSLRELRAARNEPRGRSGSGPARPGPGGDSILAALMELEDYAFTEYSSGGADFGAKDGRLVLLGTPDAPANLIRDGEELTADSALVFSEETGKVWSLGSEAVYKPRIGDPVNSRVIVFDLNEERGTALDATTKYASGAEWILHGDLTSLSEEALYGNRMRFTSCELEEPHYHFASNNVKIVGDNILVARPVKLYFEDVPVAWLPFIAQSMSRGRASGILTPSFSINDIVRTSRGYRRRISNLGFYWAMSDYSDATLSMDWWSEEFLSLTGSLRYSWARQFLGGQMNFRRYWRSEGGSELAFDANNNWEISERTRLSVRARYASSSSFVRRTSFDPREVVQSIDSDGGLNHRFDWGTMSLSANRRQFLNDDRVEMTLPSLNLSLSPLTFFRAPPNSARFYNNITWTGSGNYRRSVYDRPEPPDSVAFSYASADRVNTDAGFSSSLTLGNFSVSSSMNVKEALTRGVPQEADSTGSAEPAPGLWMGPLGPGDPLYAETAPGAGLRDETETDLTWNASINYQQRLIGSTTLTPSLRISGRM
ncbi:putative LPS assembly protein LptD, partial [Gemmatimonadota bacterium]